LRLRLSTVDRDTLGVMDDIFSRWQVRQDLLGAVLKAHGAEKHDWRADLGLGRFWWQAPGNGPPSVVADAKVLGSWALSNGSLLAAWENTSLPPSACVAPVAGVPARHMTRDEKEVWAWGFAIAEGSRAEFVYRAPNAQAWIFLGLWNVRSAVPGDQPFEAGPPWEHVRAVLRGIEGVALAELRVLARNYGRTFVEDPIRKGTRWEAPLRALGERLVAAAELDEAKLRAELKAVLAETPDGEA